MKNDGVLVKKAKREEGFVRGGEKEPKRNSIAPGFMSAHQVFEEITQTESALIVYRSKSSIAVLFSLGPARLLSPLASNSQYLNI